MEIKLSNLLSKQRDLDARINKEHGVTHQNTKEERFLALLVELGELANATRAFKYWSLKPSEARVTLLDEYADGLHFFLSLAIVFDFNLDRVQYVELPSDKKIVVHTLLEVYDLVTVFRKEETEAAYLRALSKFLSVGSALLFSPTDISNAYDVKLLENYKRQDTKY